MMQADGVLVECPVCSNINVILRQSGDIRQARRCIVCDYILRFEPVPVGWKKQPPQRTECPHCGCGCDD